MTSTTADEQGLRTASAPEAPTTPTKVPLEGWKDLGRRTVKRAKRDRVSMMAGSVAYHSFVAIFPIVIALLGLTALLHLGSSQLRQLVKGIGQALPHGAAGVLQNAVTAAQHRTGGAIGVVVVAVLISVWSASGALTTVQTGLDIAYGVPQERKFVAARLRALLMLGIVLVLGGTASVLIVFAKPLGHAIESHVPLHGTGFTVVWTVVRWVGALLLISTLFSLLYRYGPNRQPPKWRWLTAGGVAATLIWVVSSLGLSYYDAATGSYSKTYGALAGVVVLLFWFYLTSLAILLGGQVNAELEREVVERGVATGAPPPEPVEPAQPPSAQTGSSRQRVPADRVVYRTSHEIADGQAVDEHRSGQVGAQRGT